MKMLCGRRHLPALPSAGGANNHQSKRKRMSLGNTWKRLSPGNRAKDTSSKTRGSPTSTAILSEEELSAHIFQDSMDQESGITVIKSLPLPPLFSASHRDGEDASSQEDIHTLWSWRQRFNKAFARHNKKFRLKPDNVNDETEKSVGSHAVFSVTTENKSVANYRWNPKVLFPDDEERSKISLKDFLAGQEHTNDHPASIEFGNIDATDSDSVASGFLAVSFDEGCAQLEIQPKSTSGSSESDDLSFTDFVGQGDHLGATYPHPASINPSISTDSTAYKREASSSPLWAKPKRTFSRGEDKDEGRDDHEDGYSRLSNGSPLNTIGTNWNDDNTTDIEWSFSQDDSSLVSALGYANKKPSWNYKIPSLCGALDDVPYDERQDSFSLASSFTRSHMPASFSQHNL